ncbi:MAG: tail fiber protein [Alistipes sp.]|nr:tail fiber protein [Alistipes sp.]
MTRFLNISTDNTLGGLSPSDEFVASQKAIKEYVDNNSSNVQVDNLTITTNASDEIQTVAAINQNSGILKFWKGSKTEYDNLPSHDPDTQYTVTGDNTAGMMPAGSIIPFAGTNIPDGYLLCDGSAVSRTTYADLFAAIGTVYGSGDGSTTFNIPNQNNVHVAGVPNLNNFEIIPKTSLSTTNTPFTVDKDGLLLIQMASYGGALEQFMIDDVLMMGLINSFTTYNGWSVGTIPIRKGTHYMRTSAAPNRTYQILFFPYENTDITDTRIIKY